MKVTPIKAFQDNYIWCIELKNQTIIVDPGQAEPVLKYLNENELSLDTILLTHKHDDHIGGVKDLKEAFPQIDIYGPIELQDIVDHVIGEGDQFYLDNESVEVMKTAGHTSEHISYLIDRHLFCGDALFSAGCGRVFTGDYQAQYDTLMKLSKLSNKVKVYAGHEYTETNLEFALTIEEDNYIIKDELAVVREFRRLDKPTLPTTIGREKDINLFMQAKSLEEFIELRQARDNF